MVVEEDSNLRNLAKSCSIFSTRSLSSPEIKEEGRLLTARRNLERTA